MQSPVNASRLNRRHIRRLKNVLEIQDSYTSFQYKCRKKTTKNAPVFLLRHFGRMMGFEPTTPGTTNQCSNRVSYNRHLGLQKYAKLPILQKKAEKNGRIFTLPSNCIISELLGNAPLLCSNPLHSRMHQCNPEACFGISNNRRAPKRLIRSLGNL